MNKKFIYLPILLFGFLAIGFYLGQILYFPSQSGGNSAVNANSFKPSDEGRKLEQIVRYIDNEYVDPIERKKLVDESISHILQELDPHSYYITAEDLQALNEPLEGNFEGIGVQFNIRKDTVVVVTPLVGGPSEKVGILAGDRIVRVEDELIAGVGIKNGDVLKLLKGEKGTKVRVGIIRDTRDELKFTIVRDRIPIHSVEVAYMLNEATGYIKISRFAKTTYDEFMEAANQLTGEGMKDLVVDVRGNGGGFLDAAVNIADEFLTEGELIVYTEGRARPREEYRATSKNLLVDIDVTVLIDEASASASEILAGAIQDNDRGNIVGRRSFGKGLVQEQTMWPDGSATRLTIARYYTPSGRCIQKPYSNGSEEYHEEMYDRYAHGELFSEDSLQVNDSLIFTTKNGDTVYGGGGIYPDVFVPYDTTKRSSYLTALVYNGIIYEWAWSYADKHRDELLAYKTPIDFAKEFSFSTELYNEFTAFAEGKGVSTMLDGARHSAPEINRRIKAYIARNIWGNEGFYPIWNKSDKVIAKGIK